MSVQRKMFGENFCAIVFSIFIVASCINFSDKVIADKGWILPPAYAKFFKFMITLHVFTFFVSVSLLVGAVLEIELLITIYLSWPVWLSFAYSCIYSFIVYSELWTATPQYNGAGFVFSLIGLILYAGRHPYFSLIRLRIDKFIFVFSLSNVRLVVHLFLCQKSDGDLINTRNKCFKLI